MAALCRLEFENIEKDILRGNFELKVESTLRGTLKLGTGCSDPLYIVLRNEGECPSRNTSLAFLVSRIKNL